MTSVSCFAVFLLLLLETNLAYRRVLAAQKHPSDFAVNAGPFYE